MRIDMAMVASKGAPIIFIIFFHLIKASEQVEPKHLFLGVKAASQLSSNVSTAGYSSPLSLFDRAPIVKKSSVLRGHGFSNQEDSRAFSCHDLMEIFHHKIMKRDFEKKKKDETRNMAIVLQNDIDCKEQLLEVPPGANLTIMSLSNSSVSAEDSVILSGIKFRLFSRTEEEKPTLSLINLRLSYDSIVRTDDFLFNITHGNLILQNCFIFGSGSNRFFITGIYSHVVIDKSIVSFSSSSDGCKNFQVTGPISQLAVQNTVFLGTADPPECFNQVDNFDSFNNTLWNMNYYDFARNSELYVSHGEAGLASLFFSDGKMSYLQLDGSIEPNVLSLYNGDIPTSVIYWLAYGPSVATILHRSNSNSSFATNNTIPDVVQLRSYSSTVCLSTLQVLRGSDILLTLNATVFKNCTKNLFKVSTKENQLPHDRIVDFVYDDDNDCLLISPEYSADLTIDLDAFGCERLIPPILSDPYQLQVKLVDQSNYTSGKVVAKIDDDHLQVENSGEPGLFATKAVATIDEDLIVTIANQHSFSSLMVVVDGSFVSQNSIVMLNMTTEDPFLYAANLADSFAPKRLKIFAPESGENICLSHVALGRSNEPDWVVISLSEFEGCRNSCQKVYNSDDECVILSSLEGNIQELVVNLNSQGCDKFSVVMAGSKSVCSSQQEASTTGDIVKAVQQLHTREFSDIKLVVNNITEAIGEAHFEEALVIPEFSTLSVIYNGSSFGRNVLATCTCGNKLFDVTNQAELNLVGMVIKNGIVSTSGGRVHVFRCSFIGSAQLQNNNGGYLTADSISMEVSGEAITTMSASRTEISLGKFATIGSTGEVEITNDSNPSLNPITLQSNATKNYTSTSAIVNCHNCTTLVQDSSLQHANSINNMGGFLNVSRIVIAEPSSFSENINLVVASSMLLVYDKETWCKNTKSGSKGKSKKSAKHPRILAKKKTTKKSSTTKVSTTKVMHTTLTNCTFQCQEDDACLAIAYNFLIKMCFMCDREPCQFPCDGDTSVYEYHDDFNFFKVEATSLEGVCLKHPESLKESTSVSSLSHFRPFNAPSTTTKSAKICKEYCGMIEPCNLATFKKKQNSTEGECKLFSAGDFEIGPDCNDTHYLEYSFSLKTFTRVAEIGCLGGESNLLASFNVQSSYAPQQCEALCLASRFCRGFQVGGSIGDTFCELYNTTDFKESCNGGEVYIDLIGDPFPKSRFASFTTSYVTITEGAQVQANRSNRLYSQDACHRHCDVTWNCVACYFNSSNFSCTTFTRNQLLLGLKQTLQLPVTLNGTLILIDYVIGKIEYEYKSGNKSVGCPVIESLAERQKESTLSLSERSCASICLHSHECNFFHRNYKNSTCDFFRKSKNTRCKGYLNSTNAIDRNTTILIDLNTNITLAGRPYYKDKHKVAVKSEFAVYNLSDQNTEQDNEEICKGLCDTFPECVATGLIYSAHKSMPYCKLFYAFLLLDESRPSVEQATYLVSLDSIQNSDDFLAAPNGVCPLLQLLEEPSISSKVLCETLCKADKSSNGYIWDEKNAKCSITKGSFFEFCPNPPQGIFMIEYTDFVYFPGGKIPYGSIPSDAIEVAQNISSLVYCESLCAAHKMCHAISYNATTNVCTLLSNCASAEKLGLKKKECESEATPYPFMSLGTNFSLNTTDLEGHNVTSVLRPEHCMAYCESWPLCNAFLFSQEQLTCSMYAITLYGSNLMHQDGPDDLYLKSASSPIFSYLPCPDKLCPVEELRNTPSSINTASSASACFTLFCQPSKCAMFSFESKTKTCKLFSTKRLTAAGCGDSGEKNYLATGFDYEEKINSTASSNLTPSTQIQVQDMTQCAVFCDALANCTAFVLDKNTYICTPLGKDYSATVAPNSVIYQPYYVDRFKVIEKDQKFLNPPLVTLGANQLRESDCKLLCVVVVECVAVVFSEIDKKCSLMNDLTTTPCISGERCEQNGYRSLVKGADQILSKSSAGKSVTDLRGKIQNLERDVGSIIDKVNGIGNLLNPTVDAISSLNSKVAGVETPVRETRMAISKITSALKLAEQIPEVGTVLKQTQLKTILQTVDNVLSTVNTPLQAVNRILQTALPPFAIVERLISKLSGYLSILSPASFLRTVTSFLLRIVLCAEDLGSQAIVESINTMVRELGTIIDGVRSVVTVVKDKIISSIEEVANFVVQALNPAIQGANNFVVGLRTTYDIVVHQFPCNVLPNMMERVLVSFPKIEFGWKDYTLDFGMFGKTSVSLPNVSIAGEFCVWLGPALDFVNQTKDALPWFLRWLLNGLMDLVSRVLNAVLTPVFQGILQATPNIDIGNSRACAKFGKRCCDPGQSGGDCEPSCVQIKVKDIVETVKYIADKMTQFSFARFLEDLFSNSIKEALTKLLTPPQIPGLDMAFLKDALDGVEQKIKDSAKDVTDKMKEIAEMPFTFMKNMENQLQPLLDQIPCDFGDFIKDMIDGSSSGDDGTDAPSFVSSVPNNATALMIVPSGEQLFGSGIPGSQRYLQQATCPRFEAITPMSTSLLKLVFDEIGSLLLKHKEEKGNQGPRPNPTDTIIATSNSQTQQQLIKAAIKENNEPRAWALLGTWFTDPIYLYKDKAPNRAGYGAAVYVRPTPDQFSGNPQEGEGNPFLLLSYILDSENELVNKKICVNRVKSEDGLIQPYDVNFSKTKRQTADLLEYFPSGLPSDYLMSVRIDFDIVEWKNGNLPTTKKETDTYVTPKTLMLRVLQESKLKIKNIIVTEKDCCGCNPGAGCFESNELKKGLLEGDNEDFGTSTALSIGTPEVTRPFMALHGGVRSKQIFFDAETFGFYLTHKKSNTPQRQNPKEPEISWGREWNQRDENYPSQECFSDGNTASFRRTLSDFKKPPPVVKTTFIIEKGIAPCTGNFKLNSNGIVTKNGINVGGTLWMDSTSQDSTSINLMTCFNEHYPDEKVGNGDRIERYEVEHIIEKSQLPELEGKNPIVDFVMAWGEWNGANGALFNADNKKGMAAKKLLYGESIYNCIEKLVKTQPKDTTNLGRCNPERNDGWKSQDCVTALKYVDILKGAQV